jgi:hypothetical protein
MTVVRLSALRTRRTLLPRNIIHHLNAQNITHVDNNYTDDLNGVSLDDLKVTMLLAEVIPCVEAG